MDARRRSGVEREARDRAEPREHVLPGAWLDEHARLLQVCKDGKELNQATPGP